MLTEQILRLVSGLLVSIYLARYLGPEDFGMLSYALAVNSVFILIAKFGTESILIKKTSLSNSFEKNIISNGFYLILSTSIISFLSLLYITSKFENNNSIETVIYIISIGIIFQPMLVVDYAFQAKNEARKTFIPKSILHITSAAIKIALAENEYPLTYIAAAYAADFLLMALTMITIKIKYKYPAHTFKPNPSIIHSLLKSSWPLFISGLAGVVLLKSDQIMLKAFLSVEIVGYYSAATKFLDSWNALVFTYTLSILPILTSKTKELESEFTTYCINLFRLVFISSVTFSLLISTFGYLLIELIYGNEYKNSVDILKFLVWTSVFTGFGYASARYLISTNMQHKIALRNLYAIILNLPLNYFLIPIWQSNGAIASSFITLFFCHYILDYFDPDLKNLFLIKSKAIFRIGNHAK